MNLKKNGSFVHKNQTQKLQLPQDTSGGSALLPSQSDELEIRTYPNCTVYVLKHIIMQQTGILISDQVISYQG